MMRLAIAALLLAALPVLGAERPKRYVARLANGQRVESDRLTNWHVGNALPQLGGTPLLDPANHFVWLRNRARRAADDLPSFVEFTNGDRLPGVVVDYRSGGEEPWHPRPPHFIVRVFVGFEPPENRPVPEVRVAAQYVRRIVWQRRDDVVYRGGTALFRDGRALPLRAVRWKSGEAHVLLADGDRQLAWDSLAELHLPAVDPWTAWLDQMAAVCPTTSTRLMQVETTTGLIVTASLACFAARFEGNSADPDRWVHGLQPAWSLDILWIPFRDIVTYRSLLPREVPLSHIAPGRVNTANNLLGQRAARIDRSVAGAPLQSGAVEFGWGLGVSGGTELVFELPGGARWLRTSVGLDRTAENGGCIRPRIFLGGDTRKLLWEGPVLVGSERVVDSGRISLDRAVAEPPALVLQVDAMIAARPPGADPLDIRDHADWCDPVLELDESWLKQEFAKRMGRRFVAWQGWNVEMAHAAEDQTGVEFSLQPNDSIPGSFEPAVRVDRGSLVLRRELKIGPRDNWLVIAATRISRRLPEPKLEVRIDGQVVRELTVPSGSGDLKDVPPLVASLAEVPREKEAVHDIEIRQLAASDAPPVQYWAIHVAPQIPTLHALIEDEGSPRAIEPGQSGTAAMTRDDRYSGRRSLRLTPAGRFRVELSDAVPVRAAPRWGEARFLQLAIRKQGGGRVALEVEDAKPRDEPARYDLGRGRPSYGAAVRIFQDELPGDWILVTRDLYADFGNMDVKSLVVGCPDGEAALLDHVYLARSRADFDLITTAGPPPRERQAGQ